MAQITQKAIPKSVDAVAARRLQALGRRAARMVFTKKNPRREKAPA